MPDANRNIELKAHCADLVRAAHAASELGAVRQGDLFQTDAYFQVPHGRLKLRETDGKPAELIWYARPDSSDFRGSDYRIVPIPDAPAARAALAAALGLRGIVRKRRELWRWHNVRIHLDQVDSLGDFVEFEAVVTDESNDATSLHRLATLVEALKISDEDRIAVSYSDLLGM